MPVAADARVGRLARGVALEPGVHHARAELRAQVEREVGQPEAVGELASGADGLRGAAAATAVVPVVGPQLERDRRDLAARAAQQERGHRAVDPAAERHQRAAGAGRQGGGVASGVAQRAVQRVGGEVDRVALARAEAPQLGVQLAGAHARGVQQWAPGHQRDGGAARGDHGAAARRLEADRRHPLTVQRDPHADLIAARRPARDPHRAAPGQLASPLGRQQMVLEAVETHGSRLQPRRGQADNLRGRPPFFPVRILLSTGARTRLLLVVAVAAIAGTVWVAGSLKGRVLDRSFKQNRAAQHMLEAMLDQETGLRGYLLTADDRFLEPFRSGEVAFRAAAAEAKRTSVRDRRLALGLIAQQEGISGQWHALAEQRIAFVRRHGTERTSVRLALRRKALMDRFRAVNRRFQGRIAGWDRAERRAATRLSAEVVLVVSLLFGGLGYLIIERGARASRRRRDRLRGYDLGQADFAETLQVAQDEQEANGLLKLHLERSIPGATAFVLNRNNSADRLEPATPVSEDSPLNEPLKGAAPRACLAVRLGRQHQRGGAVEPLLACAVCGRVPAPPPAGRCWSPARSSAPCSSSTPTRSTPSATAASRSRCAWPPPCSPTCATWPSPSSAPPPIRSRGCPTSARWTTPSAAWSPRRAGRRRRWRSSSWTSTTSSRSTTPTATGGATTCSRRRRRR